MFFPKKNLNLKKKTNLIILTGDSSYIFDSIHIFRGKVRIIKKGSQGTTVMVLGLVTASLVLVILILFTMCNARTTVPANFVFGDSLVDVGNNNYIVTLSRANYAPNGIDFGSPTGRFTNGRTIVDIVCQELGSKEPTPPYLAPTTRGSVILRGVNYASGGGGILNSTGKLFGGRINLDEQLDNFGVTRGEIMAHVGEMEAAKLLEKALFSVTIGSNDLINNYFTPVVSSFERKLVPPPVFVDAMISRLRSQLTRLYEMGGRKIVVTNVGPVGCIPFEREVDLTAGIDRCAAQPNLMARMYNLRLRSLVEELNSNLRGSTFVYADVFHIVYDILQNYASYGFASERTPCCGIAAGKVGGLIPCGPSSTICTDRSKYVFWDPYHPSDSANLIIARRLLSGSSDDIFPFNIRQLVDL